MGTTEKEAAGVQEFGETIKGLNKQPLDWWLQFADETLYVHRSEPPIVLYRSKDFAKVVAYAKDNPTPGALIVPVPSAEEIRETFAGVKKGFFD